MKNKNNKNGAAPIIGILSFILIVLISIIGFKLSRGYVSNVYYNLDDMKRDVLYERYDYLNSGIHRGQFKIKKKSPEYIKYEAFSDYMDSALIYHAYDSEGASQRKDELKKKMDKNLSEMGSELSSLTKDIDESLKEAIVK